MRTRSVLLTTLVALIGATPATAAIPVLGPADGVQATHTDTTLVVTFAGDPAKWKPLAGREVAASCTLVPDVRGLLLADAATDDLPDPVSGDQLKIGADGTVRFRLSTNKPFDVCDLTGFGKRGELVTLAQAAVTPNGLTWLDESRVGKALCALLTRAAGPGGYRPLAALGAGPVALAGPAGAPGPGELGYWTDGAHHAVVSALSAAGRLLLIEDLGDGMLRTNVLEQGSVLDAVVDATFGELFGDDDSAATDMVMGSEERRALEDRDGERKSPYRGKAVDSRDGVRGTFSGKRLVVRFTGHSAAAVRRVAGRRVRVSCIVRPLRVLFGGKGAAPAGRAAVVRVPRRGATLRVALRGTGDLCFIADDGKLVASVAPTDTGRRWWADIQAIKLMTRLSGNFAAPGGQAYLASAAVAAGRKGITAVAGPDATAPLGRVGIWTDGARQAMVAVKSASGRRMVTADEGDGMARSNAFGDLLGMLLLLFSDGMESLDPASF